MWIRHNQDDFLSCRGVECTQSFFIIQMLVANWFCECYIFIVEASVHGTSIHCSDKTFEAAEALLRMDSPSSLKEERSPGKALTLNLCVYKYLDIEKRKQFFYLNISLVNVIFKICNSQKALQNHFLKSFCVNSTIQKLLSLNVERHRSFFTPPWGLTWYQRWRYQLKSTARRRRKKRMRRLAP